MKNSKSYKINISAIENMTCVPKEGIFMFSNDKLNYSDAITKCDEYGGMLANIITEEASNKVANVLVKSNSQKNKLLQAYVGLNDIEQEGTFLSINGKH